MRSRHARAHLPRTLAKAAEPARYLSWPVDTLRRVLEKKPGVRATLQSIVSRDLAEKVRALTQSPQP